MMSSFTAPVKARWRPVRSSSNLGHRMPGVSSRSSPWSTWTHCLPRVTPGRSPALADFRPATLLMKVDLPTLGTPTTMARTGRPTRPFSRQRAICSFRASRTVGPNCPTPLPVLASVSSTAKSFPRNQAPQARLPSGSAWSARLRTTSRGFCPQMASMSGLRLDRGMRASTSSTTMSTSFRSASICRRVLVMWPGYHWMFMGKPSF